MIHFSCPWIYHIKQLRYIKTRLSHQSIPSMGDIPWDLCTHSRGTDHPASHTVNISLKRWSHCKISIIWSQKWIHRMDVESTKKAIWPPQLWIELQSDDEKATFFDATGRKMKDSKEPETFAMNLRVSANRLSAFYQIPSFCLQAGPSGPFFSMLKAPVTHENR